MINQLKVLTCILFMGCFAGVTGQEQEYLEIRGEVLRMDGMGVPFANIMSMEMQNGTAADYYGKFRFFVKAGDTLQISAIGFQTAEIAVPGHLEAGIYPLRVKLQTDTLELSETVITPWPETWEEFRQAFVELDVPGETAVIEIPDEAIKQAIRDAKPEGGLTLPGPVSLLYNAFSREARYKRKLESLKGESRRFEIIRKRIGPEVLANICGSEVRDVMERFVARCGITDAFLAEASELDLIQALYQCAGEKDTTNQKNPNNEAN